MKVHASQHDLYENLYSVPFESNKIDAYDRMGRLWLKHFPPSTLSLYKGLVEYGNLNEYLISFVKA